MFRNGEIARLKIQEAIQSGLKAQEVHRALKQKKLPPVTATIGAQIQEPASNREPAVRSGWFNAFIQSIRRAKSAGRSINVARITVGTASNGRLHDAALLEEDRLFNREEDPEVLP